MKKTTRRPPGIVVRMAPKRLVDHRAQPGAILIDRVFNRRLGRFEDTEDEIGLDDFSLEQDDKPPPNDRLEATTAVVGAAFEAATGPDLRGKLRHGQALCAIVQIPTPAWAEPVAAYYRTSFGDRWIQRVNYGADLTEFQNRTGSTAVSLALAAGQSVVGISADVGLLPQILVGAADLLIRLAPPSAAVVRSAIARFAGRASVELEDSVVAELTSTTSSPRCGLAPVLNGSASA
jgi:hypothetical protein